MFRARAAEAERVRLSAAAAYFSNGTGADLDAYIEHEIINRTRCFPNRMNGIPGGPDAVISDAPVVSGHHSRGLTSAGPAADNRPGRLLDSSSMGSLRPRTLPELDALFRNFASRSALVWCRRFGAGQGRDVEQAHGDRTHATSRGPFHSPVAVLERPAGTDRRGRAYGAHAGGSSYVLARRRIVRPGLHCR